MVRMRLLLLSLPIFTAFASCADDESPFADHIEGTVKGSSLGSSPTGFAVHRLADTKLSPRLETLHLYFGEGFDASACPDIAAATGSAATMTVALRGDAAPTKFDVCPNGDLCGSDYVDITTTWRLPSGETIVVAAGTVNIMSFTGERVGGSLSLSFDGEDITGPFDIPVKCVDDRPPA